MYDPSATKALSNRQIAQTLANRDFAGRRIVEPGSPWWKKAGQYAEYTAGNLVSPYGSFGPTVQPGAAKGGPLHELLAQAFDIKLPTSRQVAGQRYGDWVTQQDATRRARNPRGLIEYGLERASPYVPPPQPAAPPPRLLEKHDRLRKWAINRFQHVAVLENRRTRSRVCRRRSSRLGETLSARRSLVTSRRSAILVRYSGDLPPPSPPAAGPRALVVQRNSVNRCFLNNCNKK